MGRKNIKTPQGQNFGQDPWGNLRKELDTKSGFLRGGIPLKPLQVSKVEEGYKGIVGIGPDGFFYVRRNSGMTGNKLSKTKDFMSYEDLYTFDNDILDVRIMDDGELLVVLNSGYTFPLIPLYSIGLNADAWGSWGGFNKMANPVHTNDTDDDGLADGLAIASGIDAESCYVDEEGQHFTPNALYGAIVGGGAAVEGHKYYIITKVKAQRATMYLQVTDNVDQYLQDYHSGNGEFEYLVQEITPHVGSTWITISVPTNAGAASEWLETVWQGSLIVDMSVAYPDGGEPSLSEFLAWAMDGASNHTGIWRSSGGQTEFSQVIKYSSFLVMPEPEWGLSIFHDKAVFTEYALINSLASPEKSWSRFAWFSEDGGETWDMILDLQNPPDTLYQGIYEKRWCHFHGCLYDQYWDRIWVFTGDQVGARGFAWSDDFGLTWQSVETSFYDQFGGHYTQILNAFALPDCVLFSSDSTYYPQQGIYRYIRGKKEDIPVLEAAFVYHHDNTPPAPTHFCRMIQQPDPNGPVYFPLARGGVDFGDNASFILATYDGYTFKEVWRNEYGSLNSEADLFMRLRMLGDRFYIDIGDARFASRETHIEGLLPNGANSGALAFQILDELMETAAPNLILQCGEDGTLKWVQPARILTTRVLFPVKAGRLKAGWDKSTDRLWIFPAGTVEHGTSTPIASSVSSSIDVDIAEEGYIELQAEFFHGNYTFSNDGESWPKQVDLRMLPDFTHVLEMAGSLRGDLAEIPLLDEKLDASACPLLTGALPIPGAEGFLAYKIILAGCTGIDVAQTIENLAAYWTGKTATVGAYLDLGILEPLRDVAAEVAALTAAGFTVTYTAYSG